MPPPASKRTTNEIATASVASEPSSASRGATRAPQIAPSTATMSGSQMRIESVMRRAPSVRASHGRREGHWSAGRRGVRPSRARDQEVEDDRGAAEQQQRGVVAQEAGLDRAHGGGAGAHDRRRAVDERPLDDDALERAAREVAERGERPRDEQIDQLIEIPLVDEQRV